jgi:hypothetical protein
VEGWERFLGLGLLGLGVLGGVAEEIEANEAREWARVVTGMLDGVGAEASELDKSRRLCLSL